MSVVGQIDSSIALNSISYDSNTLQPLSNLICGR